VGRQTRQVVTVALGPLPVDLYSFKGGGGREEALGSVHRPDMDPVMVLKLLPLELVQAINENDIPLGPEDLPCQIYPHFLGGEGSALEAGLDIAASDDNPLLLEVLEGISLYEDRGLFSSRWRLSLLGPKGGNGQQEP